MLKPVRLISFVLAVLLGFFFLATDCDNSGGRIPINGEVSFEGTPIDYGYVQFAPMAGTSAPTAGGEVKDGVYRIDAVRGLLPGSYKVNIQAWKRDGKRSLDPVTGEVVEGGNLKQTLPTKYNDASELVAEIESGKKTYHFHLEP